MRSILTLAGLLAAVAIIASCGKGKIPPATVNDLMADPLSMENVVMRCNRDVQKMHSDIECRNARTAAAKLDELRQKREADKLQEEFERVREQRRVEQERVKQAQDAASRVDPYTMPVAPAG
jgi:alpha-D-ribose 1-methylphosphonate 5-triphosphate synthase subunit PhnG